MAEVSDSLLTRLMTLTGDNIIPIASVLSLGLGLYLLRELVGGAKCRSKVNMKSKFVIITGSNTGIGKETAKQLCLRGARVMITCRDPLKGAAAADDIFQMSGQRVEVKTLDLADLDSVRKFAYDINKRFPRLDVLINNAGVMMCPKLWTKQGHELQFGTNHLGHFLLTYLLLGLLKKSAHSRVIVLSSASYKGVAGVPKRQITKQGFELQFGTNHLGHFLLTNLLKELMVRTPHSRIVVVTGKIYQWYRLDLDDLNSEKSYSPTAAYGKSKLANVLFTRELARRLKGTGVTVNCLHPGVVNSDLPRNMADMMPRVLWWSLQPFLALVKLLMLKTVYQGAQTTLHCASSEELIGVSGKYFSDCTETSLLPHATDEDAARKLWVMSEEMTGLTSIPDQVSPGLGANQQEQPECDQKSGSKERSSEHEPQRKPEPVQLDNTVQVQGLKSGLIKRKTINLESKELISVDDVDDEHKSKSDIFRAKDDTCISKPVGDEKLVEDKIEPVASSGSRQTTV